jgi:hypothetical protein
MVHIEGEDFLGNATKQKKILQILSFLKAVMKVQARQARRLFERAETLCPGKV